MLTLASERSPGPFRREPGIFEITAGKIPTGKRSTCTTLSYSPQYRTAARRGMAP